jgi:hypothetical protein
VNSESSKSGPALVFIRNEQGQYLTRVGLTENVSWTSNRNLAYCFDRAKMEKPGAVEHFEKHLGCKITLEARS